MANTRVKKTMNDLPEAITPDNFASIMGYLYPDNVHKELYWTRNPPEQTLYRWYYEFIKASRERDGVRDEIAADPAAARKMAKLDQAFGETHTDFLTWWDQGGAEKFAERGVPRIKVLNGQPDEENGHGENRLRIEIPLHLSRDILLEQLNFLMAAYHPGDDLRRHAYSTARIKIFPRQRYAPTDYGFLLKLWKAVRIYLDAGTNVPWVQVYCEVSDMAGVWEWLQHLPTNDQAGKKKRERLKRDAKKLYNQANILMRNALIGQFPRNRMDPE